MAKKFKNIFIYEPGDVVLIFPACRRAMVTKITFIDFNKLEQELEILFRNGNRQTGVKTSDVELLFKKKFA